jgi:hypothetical protein
MVMGESPAFLIAARHKAKRGPVARPVARVHMLVHDARWQGHS